MAIVSREILRRMRDGVRPVGFMLGLAAIIGAGQHWVMAIAEFPDDSYWIFLALPLMALLVTTFLYAPAVLLHALGTRAVGEAPPFLESCKAALRALPALGFAVCFVVSIAYALAS